MLTSSTEIDMLIDEIRRTPAKVLTEEQREAYWTGRALDRSAPAPPPAQALLHEPGQLGIAGQLAPPRPGPPRGRHPLRGERPVLPAGRVKVAAQLPADRGRAPTHLPGDRAHAPAAPMQISDRHPLVLGQEPRRDLPRRRVDHRRIMQPPSTAADHRAPVSPPLPRSRVDPHHPTRLQARHPRGDQPRELLPLRHLRRRTRPTTTRHPNSRAPQALR